MYIVFGYGKTGKAVANFFVKEGIGFCIYNETAIDDAEDVEALQAVVYALSWPILEAVEVLEESTTPEPESTTPESADEEV